MGPSIWLRKRSFILQMGLSPGITILAYGHPAPPEGVRLFMSVWYQYCAIISFYHWGPHSCYHKQHLKWIDTEGNLPNRLSHIVTSWPSSPRAMNRVQALTAEQRISWELGHKTSGLGSLSDSGTDSNIIYKHEQMCPCNMNIYYILFLIHALWMYELDAGVPFSFFNRWYCKRLWLPLHHRHMEMGISSKIIRRNIINAHSERRLMKNVSLESITHLWLPSFPQAWNKTPHAARSDKCSCFNEKRLTNCNKFCNVKNNLNTFLITFIISRGSKVTHHTVCQMFLISHAVTTVLSYMRLFNLFLQMN